MTLSLCLGVGLGDQNLGHFRILFLSYFFLYRIIHFQIGQQALFTVDFPYDFGPYCFVPQGGARGQNLEHLCIFSFLLLFCGITRF